MPYEWDEQKRRENLDKHGIDFAAVEESFQWDTALIEPSPRDGEMRWRAIGYIGERLHILIYTERDSSARIISLRKANAREERRYARTYGIDTGAD